SRCFEHDFLTGRWMPQTHLRRVQINSLRRCAPIKCVAKDGKTIRGGVNANLMRATSAWLGFDSLQFHVYTTTFSRTRNNRKAKPRRCDFTLSTTSVTLTHANNLRFHHEFTSFQRTISQQKICFVSTVARELFRKRAI